MAAREPLAVGEAPLVQAKLAQAPLVQVKGLVKRYGDFTLGPVDLQVDPGEVVGFVGANGAGKTTTIHSLFGAYEPDAGSAALLGVTMGFGSGADEAAMAEAKAGAGFVFDTLSFGELRVREVGRLGARAWGDGWDQALFDQELAQAQIDPAKKTRELSRGMGMRLQLAFALAHHPRVLLLDEATAGLDPMAREEVLDKLRGYMEDEGHGILMSSHITSDIESIGDRVVGIDQGRIVFDLPVDDVRDVYGVARCTGAQAQQLEGSGLFPAGSLRVMRRPHATDVLVPDAAAMRRARPEIPVEKPTLEEFMVLMMEGEQR